MSPSVSNFVHDLVDMAKAMDELPIVQHNLTLAEAKVESLSQTVQDRELSIIRLKEEITSLQADKLRLEASRDDVELRFLEADERADKASSLLSGITDTLNRLQADVTSIRDTIVPPKPEPVEAMPSAPVEEAKPSQDAPVVEPRPEPFPEQANSDTYYNPDWRYSDSKRNY